MTVFWSMLAGALIALLGVIVGAALVERQREEEQ